MGVSELDAISKSYGLATALLIAGCVVLARVCRSLYSENQLLHTRLEQLTEQRSKALESIVAELAGEKHADHPSA